MTGDLPNYAMSKLLERLVDEGYVRKSRTNELLERAHNMEHDKGFLTNAELRKKKRRTTTTDEDLIADLLS